MDNLSDSQNKLLKCDIEELIADSANTKPSRPDHDFRIALIKARAVQSLNSSIENLRESINSNSESSQKLAKRVFWLNVIITVAIVIGTIIAFANYFKQL